MCHERTVARRRQGRVVRWIAAGRPAAARPERFKTNVVNSGGPRALRRQALGQRDGLAYRPRCGLEAPGAPRLLGEPARLRPEALSKVWNAVIAGDPSGRITRDKATVSRMSADKATVSRMSAKTLGKQALGMLFQGGQRIGFDILPRHFYSAIPEVRALRRSETWRL